MIQQKTSKVGAALTRFGKYLNKKDGDFDSRREARRHAQLVLLQRAGRIRNLKRQVNFELIPVQRDGAGGLLEKSVHYHADFTYEERVEIKDITGSDIDWVAVVEDIKSPVTKKLPAYIIKRKLMLHLYKIQIKET